MAEILIFHYQKGDSILHKTDVRLKLAGLLCFSLLLLPVSLYRLLILIPAVLLCHAASGVRIGKFAKESLFFFIMGALIFLSNSLTSGLTEGGARTVEGLMTGGLRTIRFFMILWMALLFTFTTDPLTVSSGIYRLLKPLPLLPARRISTILGLSLTLLPVILDEIREIREAVWSRCGMNRRTPLRNLVRTGLPLLEGILTKAEHMSDAMESRLFSEDATPPENGTGSGNLASVIFLLLITALILLPEYLLSAPSVFPRLWHSY